MLSSLKNLFSRGAPDGASGSSEKVTNLKEKTRETAQNLLNVLNDESVQSFGPKTPDVEVLGGVYKMMVKIQADDMMQKELEEDQRNMRYLNDEMRHKELIDALSFSGKFKKPKKQKVVTEKQQKPKEKKRTENIKKTTAQLVKSKKISKPKALDLTSSVPKSPTAVSGTSVLPKIGLGVAAAVGLGAATSAIAGAESGGDYDVTYGDRRDKTGKLVNSKGYPTPEQMFNKKLTDMTLAEVKEFGRVRSSISPNSGATGAYQFMPSTLFGNSKSPGLVQQLGLSMDTKFDAKTQDALNNLLQKQNRDSLAARGVPLTSGNEYMAHYIGAAGAAAVYRNTDSSLTVAQVMANANLTPPGKENNPELYRIRASDFERVLADRIAKRKQLMPHSTGQSVGVNIDNMSKDNKQLNEQLATPSSSSSVINQTNMNMYQSQQQNRPSQSYDDRSAYEKKSRT